MSPGNCLAHLDEPTEITLLLYSICVCAHVLVLVCLVCVFVCMGWEGKGDAARKLATRDVTRQEFGGKNFVCIDIQLYSQLN